MSKTLSFAVLHMSVAFVIGYLFTGSVLAGGALALVEPLCNTVVFHLHEKVWRRIDMRRAAADDARMSASLQAAAARTGAWGPSRKD